MKDVKELLNTILDTTLVAKAALADEHEGNFTVAVKAIQQAANSLANLVDTW